MRRCGGLPYKKYCPRRRALSGEKFSPDAFRGTDGPLWTENQPL